jgi:LmbE family N-acetylglucosaminyl deacetylase
MPSVALSVLAHPDDAEFLCAGTLIRLKREHGWEIHIATMTAGDCGSAEHSPDEISSIRQIEARNACDTIDAIYHCVGELDLRVYLNERTVDKLCRLLNAVRPSVVFTHSPEDYHLDHEQTSNIVRAAAFAAPIRNYLHRGHHHEPFPPLDRIPHLYYCDPLEGKDQFGREIAPHFRIGISDVIDDKAKMLECHESQRAWLRKHHGVDNLVESMREWSSRQGERAGVGFAEGFRQHLGHSFPQDNILASLLGVV